MPRNVMYFLSIKKKAKLYHPKLVNPRIYFCCLFRDAAKELSSLLSLDMLSLLSVSMTNKCQCLCYINR